MQFSILGFVGTIASALFGFWLGQRTFRHDQAFQRRLEWHEQAVRRLIRASRKIEEAANITEDPVLDKEKDDAWDEADRALDDVRGLDMEAELYASDAAYNAIGDAIRHAEEHLHTGLEVLRVVPGRREPSPEQLRVSLNQLKLSSRVMQHAASRLATDIRQSFRLPPVTRRYRLYDDEVTRLLPRKEEVTFGERIVALKSLLKTGRKRGQLIVTKDETAATGSSNEEL